jgi:nitrate reductase alpha subunit
MQIMSEELREAIGDFVVWNLKTGKPEIITMDDVGKSGPWALGGKFTVETVDGKKVEVRPVFDLIKEHVSHFTPEVVSQICHVSKDAIVWLAREIGKNKTKTLIAVGMGPNHFFNNDLKDRAIFLVCALTKNVGFPGGNIGSYAGNYRGAYFNGLPFYIGEDPFDIELDPTKSPRVRFYELW